MFSWFKRRRVVPDLLGEDGERKLLALNHFCKDRELVLRLLEFSINKGPQTTLHVCASIFEIEAGAAKRMPNQEVMQIFDLAASKTKQWAHELNKLIHLL